MVLSAHSGHTNTQMLAIAVSQIAYFGWCGENSVEPSVEVRCLVFPVAKVMEYYCPPCETAMCQECTSGEHGEHPTVPLKDVVEQHKASLQDQLDAVKKRYSSNTNTTKQQTLHFAPSSQHDAVNEAVLYGLAVSRDCLPRVSLSLPGCQRSTRPCRHCQRSCSS